LGAARLLLELGSGSAARVRRGPQQPAREVREAGVEFEHLERCRMR
jgi:hypothetical protein